MSKDAEQDRQVSPEVTEKAVRRRFTAEYKERILDEADRSTEATSGSLELASDDAIDVTKQLSEMALV